MPPPTATGKRLKTSVKVCQPVKEKQPAKSSIAKGITVLYEVALTEAEQIKLSTKRSLTQTHISHVSGSGADKRTGIILGVLDVPTYESDDEEISWKSTEHDDNGDDDKMSEHDVDVDDQSNDDDQDDQDDDDDEQTDSDNDDDEDNDEDSHGMNVEGDEGANEEYEANELYRDVNINLERRDVQLVDVQTTQVIKDTHVTLTLVNPEAVSSILVIIDKYIDHRMNKAMKVAVRLQSDRLQDEAQAENEDFLNKLDENIQKIINTSFAIAADLSELELKKILIKKIESNKSIHRSDEQKNLYKALVDAYECYKLILDTYGDTVTLKRRPDDKDKDEEPFAGSNRGSKRRREGKEPESTTALATYFFHRRCLKANKRAKVYYECMEPFKSLMCLWVRNKSIAAIWLKKVVTP
nr:hypothetical protein [Tanacetum cinerariifolium]